MKYDREAVAIVAGLARILDDDSSNPFKGPESLHIDTKALLEQAGLAAAREGPAAARRLLLSERDRCGRWLREANLGLAIGGSADGTDLIHMLRGSSATYALHAARYGLESAVPVEQVITEVVAADYGHLAQGQSAQVTFLATCYELSGRPDLALSILIRSPIAHPTVHLRAVLHMARRAYAQGHVGRIADLAYMDPWTDGTGLARELVLRLVIEREPTQADLRARVGARRQALDTGDWPALLDLALSDVMWLDETSVLWMALSVILKMNNAPVRAELARDVAEAVAREESDAR